MRVELTGIVLTIAAVAVESVAQLWLKIGTGSATAPKRWIVLGALAYGVEILLYTLALHFLDVSVAFPLGSLCFVGVALLSKFFLGETVSRVRWLGVGFIFAGAVCVTL
jgi:undecaprenyl phosphate-alpha-L-ara4N flippase subunit ArnE